MSTRFFLKHGSEIDLAHFEGRVPIPTSKNFIQIKFVNSKSGRHQCAFQCCEKNGTCNRVFRKWHNLFDHLRIHTGERPFLCPVDGCDYNFNQLSNQNKHLDTHRGKEKLPCKKCKGLYDRSRILFHFEREHNSQ